MPTLVAGVEIDLRGQTFYLWRCPACAFQFKHPHVDERALMESYRRAAAGHWEVQPDPYKRQFDLIKQAVERHAPPPAPGERRRVLDIGCGNGALLSEFGPEWEQQGIEPSVAAAELARQRGVTILRPTLDGSIPGTHWDVVLAIDVVEHILSPRPFFENVARALKIGGILVILTGDTDARAWRWMGSRYWYCSLVEHVSFFCRETLSRIGEGTGMIPIECRTMSHIRASWGQRGSELMKNVAFCAAQRIGWLPGAGLRERVLYRRGPGWTSARDHLLSVMRRLG